MRRHIVLILSAFVAVLFTPTVAQAQSCVPSSTTLCLKEGRFSVQVDWRNQAGTAGVGTLVPGFNSDSGLFWFFRPDNWEMLVKMVDGCSNNGSFWVFAAATTNVEYTLTVRDEVTGSTRVYFNPLGNSADAIVDTQAFETCASRGGLIDAPSSHDSINLMEAPGIVSRAERAKPSGLARFEVKATCPDGDAAQCLIDSRFRAEVTWHTASGSTGIGRAVPLESPDSGLFWFFRADNWEMLVKMVDGCANNDHFWLFSAATTNVGYTLRVTDTQTGVVRAYENPIGVSASAVVDTLAFATCDAGPEPPEPGKGDLVAPLPTLFVDPPTPRGSGTARVVVDSPGATSIRLLATGSGCGQIANQTISGDFLEQFALVAPFGTCSLRAEIQGLGQEQIATTRFTVEPTELLLPAIELVGGYFVPGALPVPSNGPSAPDILAINGPSTIINGGTIQLRIELEPGVQPTDARTVNVVVPTADGFSGYYRAPVTRDGNVLIAELALDPGFFAPSSAQARRRFESQALAMRNPFDVFIQIVDRLGRIGTVFPLLLETEEVGSEAVQVSLSWDTPTDVDLHVVEPPPGEEIYWGNSTSITGGQLDLDSNPACSIDGVNNENVTWPTGAPLPGEHIVRVNYWRACGSRPANYTVTTRVCGDTSVFTGRFEASDATGGGAGSGVEITRFTPDACSFRVRGKAEYEDRAQTPIGLSSATTKLPIRFARVLVKRASDNQVLASGVTKQDGRFDLQFQNTGPAGYFVEVRSEASTSTLKQVVKNDQGTVYFARSAGVINEQTMPDRVDLIVTANEAGPGPAFNIFDMGVVGVEKIREEYGVTPPNLTWVWTKGKKGLCTNPVSCFKRSLATISVLSLASDPDEYDDMVLLHEFGHKWQHEQSRSDSPGGSHSETTRVDPQLAWGEGSATYFAAHAKGSPVYIDTKPNAVGVLFSIESLPATVPLGAVGNSQNGAHSEALVAAILWDLSDGGTEAKDTVQNEMGVFEAASYLGSSQFADRATTGADLVDLLDGWFCKGNGMRGNANSGVEGIVAGIHLFPYDFAVVDSCQ